MVGIILLLFGIGIVGLTVADILNKKHFSFTSGALIVISICSLIVMGILAIIALIS